MRYWQFVIKFDQWLPVTTKTKFRKEHTAMNALKTYQERGLKGCLCMFDGEGNEHGIKEVREF